MYGTLDPEATSTPSKGIVYERRRPETGTLYQVVRDNLQTLYAAVEDGFAAPQTPYHGSLTPQGASVRRAE